jgi:RNA polymerase sigma-70 factor (ECF subfamily)
MLREMEGLQTDEICQLMEISATNSWTMLYRARSALRRCLELNWFGRGL